MKLVRDCIPDIIVESGNTCISRSCKSIQEFRSFLREKMIEEVDEFLEEPSEEEAADIYEVLRALTNLYNIYMEDVVIVADNKRSKRGGFDDGIILESVKNS